jgi:hypothetical protein
MVIIMALVAWCLGADAQTDTLRADAQTKVDSLFAISSDSALLRQLAAEESETLQATNDTPTPPASVADDGKGRRDWSSWRPDPQRALWLALAFPGGGQIYNRKYWKLPLVYGGFMGCIYALTWNNMMYKDYAQAYLDIMDSDPGTASYNKFLHLGRQITPENEERYKTIFKKRKDRFRRYRDLSFFVMVGVYALSVIDAYVDAELSEFDLSKDLSLRVSPGVISTPAATGKNPLQASNVGLNCSLNF